MEASNEYRDGDPTELELASTTRRGTTTPYGLRSGDPGHINKKGQPRESHPVQIRFRSFIKKVPVPAGSLFDSRLCGFVDLPERFGLTERTGDSSPCICKGVRGPIRLSQSSLFSWTYEPKHSRSVNSRLTLCPRKLYLTFAATL